MGGSVEVGQGVQHLRGQEGRATDPKSETLHPAVKYRTSRGADQKAVEVPYFGVEQNLSKHFRDICGKTNTVLAETDEYIEKWRVEAGTW